MSLRDEMVRTGNLLFRWRSYLPLLLLPLVLLPPGPSRSLGRPVLSDGAWEAVCAALAAAGLAVRVLAVGSAPAGTSGRNTRGQRAESLNTTGIYSLVRHPLYLGNFLIWLGVSLLAGSWCVPVIVALAFFLYYERIMLAEEDFLRSRFGEEFESWARETPAFIPAARRWKPPRLPFSWRSVLARENSTLLAIIATFFALHAAKGFLATRSFRVSRGWIILMSGGVAFYLALRWLRKRKALSVEGR